MATLPILTPPPPQVVAYPGLLPASPSPSRGSYTPTFIVLAVVAALAVVACILGQIWARRYLRPRSRRGCDVEDDGYNMSIPPAKPAMNGVGKGEAKHGGGGATKEGKLAENGGAKGGA